MNETIVRASAPSGEAAHRTPDEANAVRWLVLIALVYSLICAVAFIGAGLEAVTGDQARRLVELRPNLFVGLMVGVLATAITQSSSTVTSVIVALVAGGLPVSSAIPMIMGSNIGTTVTNTLVSLGHVGQRAEFRRAFAAATVHDFFNLLAVAIFLPLEVAFGWIEGLALRSAELVHHGPLALSDVNVLKLATAPATALARALATSLPHGIGGILVAVIGVAAIMGSIRSISQLLKSLMVGRALRLLHRTVGRGDVLGIVSGALMTFVVQSSSTSTSLIVPLAGSGQLRLRQVYPFTLGTNIGTTLTAVLAASAVTGALAVAALEIALVHLFFNVFAVVAIFGIPVLRPLPLVGARWLSDIAAKRRLVAVAWVGGTFVLLPLVFIVLSLGG